MDQKTAAPHKIEEVKTILIAREHARADAWIRRDRRALEALLAEAYVETNILGTFSRQEILEKIFPALILQNFVMEEPLIRMIGTELEISYRSRQRFTAGKRQVEGTFRVTAGYIREGNRCRLVHWESRPEGTAVRLE